MSQNNTSPVKPCSRCNRPACKTYPRCAIADIPEQVTPPSSPRAAPASAPLSELKCFDALPELPTRAEFARVPPSSPRAAPRALKLYQNFQRVLSLRALPLCQQKSRVL